MLAVGDDGLLRVAADDPDLAAFALHVDPLGVGAGLDENDPARRRRVGDERRLTDRLLQRGEVAGAVRRHDRIRWGRAQAAGQTQAREATVPGVYSGQLRMTGLNARGQQVHDHPGHEVSGTADDEEDAVTDFDLPSAV